MLWGRLLTPPFTKKKPEDRQVRWAVVVQWDNVRKSAHYCDELDLEESPPSPPPSPLPVDVEDVQIPVEEMVIDDDPIPEPEPEPIPVPEPGTGKKPPKHPAKFSAEVLEAIFRLLDKYQLLDARLLDPMAGVGGIAKIRAWGFRGEIHSNDLEPEWVEQTPKIDRVFVTSYDYRQPVHGPESFDLIVTSPSYGTRMADTYTDGSVRHHYTAYMGHPLREGNTGAMQWGRRYRETHEAIWKAVRTVLRRGGYFILNISNHWRGGVEVQVTHWHLETLNILGFEVVETIRVQTRRHKHGANALLRCDHEKVVLLRLVRKEEEMPKKSPEAPVNKATVVLPDPGPAGRLVEHPELMKLSGIPIEFSLDALQKVRSENQRLGALPVGAQARMSAAEIQRHRALISNSLPGVAYALEMAENHYNAWKKRETDTAWQAALEQYRMDQTAYREKQDGALKPEPPKITAIRAEVEASPSNLQYLDEIAQYRFWKNWLQCQQGDLEGKAMLLMNLNRGERGATSGFEDVDTEEVNAATESVSDLEENEDAPEKEPAPAPKSAPASAPKAAPAAPAKPVPSKAAVVKNEDLDDLDGLDDIDGGDEGETNEDGPTPGADDDPPENFGDGDSADEFEDIELDDSGDSDDDAPPPPKPAAAPTKPAPSKAAPAASSKSTPAPTKPASTAVPAKSTPAKPSKPAAPKAAVKEEEDEFASVDDGDSDALDDADSGGDDYTSGFDI